MLTQVDVVQGDGSDTLVLTLPILGATPKSSLLVRWIQGLNPADITLFIGDYARDGGLYQGRRVGNRNVVMLIDLNPNPALGETVSSLREMLYKAFLDPLVDADYVKINLVDDLGRVLYLIGHVEKFETEPFTSETAVQISMICPDPYFRNNTETVLTNPTGWTTVPFTYAGTAETGFYTKIVVTTPTSTLTLDNNGKTMVFNRSFAAGDVVEICTIRGNRFATVTVGAADPVSILGNLTYASEWIELHSQANVLKVYGDTTSSTVAGIRELRYHAAYWGV